MTRALQHCKNFILDADDFESLYFLVAPEKWLLVCDKSFWKLPERIQRIYYSHRDNCLLFDDFEPNPKYESVVRGVSIISNNPVSLIVAVGGGSAIDVAKCIKLFCGLQNDTPFFRQAPRYDLVSQINLIALPTTAGTGSESTKHAVLYYDGVKQSICDDAIVPDAALLDPVVLEGLPVIHKKAALLDALCQACESWWSNNSDEDSVFYSEMAILSIVDQWESYLEGDAHAAEVVLRAANFAGRAINITKTTAPHAMSYKMSSMFGLPHGIAVGLCFPVVWRHMLAKADERLLQVFDRIAHCFHVENAAKAIAYFEGMLVAMNVSGPRSEKKSQDASMLAHSVNPERLSNNPVPFTTEELQQMYEEILQC